MSVGLGRLCRLGRRSHFSSLLLAALLALRGLARRFQLGNATL